MNNTIFINEHKVILTQEQHQNHNQFKNEFPNLPSLKNLVIRMSLQYNEQLNELKAKTIL